MRVVVRLYHQDDPTSFRLPRLILRAIGAELNAVEQRAP